MLNQARRTKGQLEREVIEMLASGSPPMTLEQVRERLGGTLMSTTVMTVLSRLQEQGMTSREWTGQSFVYTAVASQAELAASRIRELLDADGDRRAVLTRFVAMLPPDDEKLLNDLLKHRYADDVRGEDRAA